MGGVMKLDLKIENLFRKKTAETFSDTEFRRIIEIHEKGTNEENGEEYQEDRKVIKIIASSQESAKNFITLVPMKSLSLEDFAFPFSGNTKIREALRLQVMPYSAAGKLELFPVVINKSGRSVNGLVWYVSPEELNLPSFSYESDGTNKIWPAPLPFISRLKEYNGTGITAYIDEENICSILWQNNKPVLYRWRKVTGDDSESKEIAWYDNYCKTREIERGGNFIINVAGDNDEDDEESNKEFREMISESLKICPWINNINLSRSVLEGAIDLERNIKFMTRAAIWLLVLGIAAISASYLRWNQLQGQVQELRTRGEKIYRENFDPSHTGRISNPVTLARDKIDSLTNTGQVAHPLEEVLADIGEIFTQTQSMDITLDIIRYNSEGIDCTGTAPDMTTVLNFRKAWEGRARLAQVDNTQFVSGIGFRFDMRVRW